MTGWSGMGGKGFRDDPPPGEGGLPPDLITLIILVAVFLGFVAFGGG